jgi:SAM-dependent methyltransferase
MTAILGFSREQVIAAVKEMYTAVATVPGGPYHFPVGREACRSVGYPDAMLEGVPDDVVESFAGVGYPFRAGAVHPGDTVLDVGAGSGTDALIAAWLVGPSGRVIALDMTPAMVRKLRERVAQHGIANVEVVEASAEDIPLPDGSVDVVTSNGVLNLVPDKRRALREIHRVLRPDGRAQIADIVIARPVPAECSGDPKLWAECVVGATVDDEYLALFRDAGFDPVTVLHERDYFALSRSAETREVARRFGARSIEIGMRRCPQPSPLERFWHRVDPRRAVRAVRRRGLEGAVALALALLACYGTLAAVAILSAAGLAIAVDQRLWSGAILLFAALATAAVAASRRAHRGWWPLAMSAAGTALLAYTQLVDYRLAIELAGFAVLAGGVATDLCLARSARKAKSAGMVRAATVATLEAQGGKRS